MQNAHGLPTPPSPTLLSPTSTCQNSPAGQSPTVDRDIEKEAFDAEAEAQNATLGGEGKSGLGPFGCYNANDHLKAIRRSTRTSTLKSISRKASWIPQIPSVFRHRDQNAAVVQCIEDSPDGYPRLASFVDSDHNFLMYRKYSWLQNRVCLYRQDELAALERDLLEMDQEDLQCNPDRLKCRQIDEDMDVDHEGDAMTTRKGLIQAIDHKLKDYHEALQRLHFVSALPAPTTRDANSFIGWNNEYKPLASGDQAFIDHRSDLASLSPPTESNKLDGFIEDCLMAFLPKSLLRRFLTSDEQKLKSRDGKMRLFDKRRVDLLVRLVLTAVVVGLLIGPSAVLFLWNGHAAWKIGIICLFTLLFASAVGICSKARRHEMLAATATYAAVLVVFLGNFGPSTNTTGVGPTS